METSDLYEIQILRIVTITWNQVSVVTDIQISSSWQCHFTLPNTSTTYFPSVFSPSYFSLDHPHPFWHYQTASNSRQECSTMTKQAFTGILPFTRCANWSTDTCPNRQPVLPVFGTIWSVSQNGHLMKYACLSCQGGIYSLLSKGL